MAHIMGEKTVTIHTIHRPRLHVIILPTIPEAPRHHAAFDHDVGRIGMVTKPHMPDAERGLIFPAEEYWILEAVA